MVLQIRAKCSFQTKIRQNTALKITLTDLLAGGSQHGSTIHADEGKGHRFWVMIGRYGKICAEISGVVAINP